MTFRSSTSLIRFTAGGAAILLIAFASVVTSTTALRNHACEYDALREWSEIVVIATSLLGGLWAGAVVFTGQRQLLIIAIVVPTLAVSALVLASIRHGYLERACLRRPLSAAISQCAIRSDQIAMRRSETGAILVVRGNGEAASCLRDWSSWHRGYQVEARGSQ